ncbi:hypothetical protein GCM10009125_23030 [Castellaniella daejeonensis]|uniref:Uncharacterized protein n=1 Tax=Castellaniella daejeonensis TaxID=659013 RepID=A0ABN0TYN8_9BURK
MMRPCLARVPARRYRKTPEGLDPPLKGDADGRAGRYQVSKQAGIGLAWGHAHRCGGSTSGLVDEPLFPV